MTTKSELSEVCTEYLEFVESDAYHEDDCDDYENPIIEVAMQFAFGDNIWDRINKAIERHENDRKIEL